MQVRRAVIVAALPSAIACGLRIEGSFVGTPDAGADAAVDVEAPPAPPPDAACPSWTVTPPSQVPRAATTTASGRLFVGGNDGDKAWIAEVDPCTGAFVREIRFAADARHASVSALAATDSALLFSGFVGDGALGENESGYVGHVDLGLGQATGDLVAGAGWSDLNRIVSAADGRIWTVGTEVIFGGDAQKGWIVVRGDGGCTSNLGVSVVGLSASADDRALVTFQTDAGAALAELVGCGVARSIAVPLPSVGAPSDMAVHGSNVYVVGAQGGSSNLDRGYVAVGDIDAGTWTFAAPIDPTAGLDVVARVHTDGVALFAGAQPNAGFGGAVPTIFRYELPLEKGAVPTWSATPFGSTLLLFGDLALSATEPDAFYVVAGGPGKPGGGIARCRRSTGCGPTP